MISLQPTIEALKGAIGSRSPDIVSRAAECWVVAPGNEVVVRPARFLPGQLDRIRGAQFGTTDEVVRDFRGGFASRQPATMAFRVKDVDLVDGVLYSGGAVRHLRERQHRLPAYMAPSEMGSGALYESWSGNRWFGNWLSDDCLTYRLAEGFGVPVATGTATGHAPRYQQLLGIDPLRVDHAHFYELFVFEDLGHNDHRRARGEAMRRQLATSRHTIAHPGVFLLRGDTGARRVLVNERAIADRLVTARGFTILDPSTATVEQIIDACAGARVVAGVEGSHLVHGLMTMPSDACLLALQPPGRAVSVLKLVTDRQGQDYALVVGEGGEASFTVDCGEVERTLDLVP